MKKGHIPIRTCIICKKKAPKFEFIRYVKKNDLLEIDEKQILPGRGFYICSEECKQKIKKYKGWLKKGKGVKSNEQKTC
ncbi:MAG TPA: DUF448 domain-containing protein [Desulfonauticus sp.]|nr:MAG: Uncharacterized protein XD41_0400 [Desulfonauticus sp. 38_4375]HCO11665.1 DUF448 domain-containing protein [Desulfonauticus sp.]